MAILLLGLVPPLKNKVALETDYGTVFQFLKNVLPVRCVWAFFGRVHST